MNCDDLQPLLHDVGAVLPSDGEAHVLDCPSCQALRLSFARVDALLLAEPAPPAPPELTARVLQAVAVRRAQDVAWARRQALLLVAAAALVAGLGLSTGWAPIDAITSSARLELNGVLRELTAILDSLLARGERALALPSPPLVVLLLLAPALLVLNGWMCAPSHRRSA